MYDAINQFKKFNNICHYFIQGLSPIDTIVTDDAEKSAFLPWCMNSPYERIEDGAN